MTHDLAYYLAVLGASELLGAIVVPQVVESNVAYGGVLQFLGKPVSKLPEGFAKPFRVSVKKYVVAF